MEVKDLFITPLYLIIFYVIAYMARPYFSDEHTEKYFIPALTLKFVGAICLGLIYQFYYNGGDTFNYFHDAKIIAEAITNSLWDGLQLFFSDGTYDPVNFRYASRLFWFEARTEFTLSRIAAIFCLLTFNTYSSVGLFFAFFSFAGSWGMYTLLVKKYPFLIKQLSFGIFYIPSVVFWGSGLMKDTIILGALGFLFWGFYYLFVKKSKFILALIVFSASLLLIKNIRVFILLGFLPPACVWILLENSKKIKNPILKIMSFPFLVSIGVGLAFYFATTVTAGDKRYDLSRIGEISKVNAEYHYRISVAQGGSAYYLGDLDGTIIGTLKLGPLAVMTTMFRPYIWEVKNVVMLLSSLEGMFIIFFCFYAVIRVRLRDMIKIFKDPYLLLALVFSVTYAFAVGITSYNFGTLVRYKIPYYIFFVPFLSILINRLDLESYKHLNNDEHLVANQNNSDSPY